MYRKLILLPLLASLEVSATPFEVFSVPARQDPLQLRILHRTPQQPSDLAPVLFLHGSSFPSELAAGFRMEGQSWMDVMARAGFDTYALDFLGYGRSDRYPEMETGGTVPLGRAVDVQADLDRAVDAVRHRSGASKVTLIAHSWGGSVAALYAQRYPHKLASLVLFAAITPRLGASTQTPGNVRIAYTEMTPEQRVESMNALRPASKPPLLAPDIFSTWGRQWLASDPLASRLGNRKVRFPAGPEQDIADLQAGRSYYVPQAIAVPTLLIRGEWDAWPSAADNTWLYDALVAAPMKKSVTVPESTHVAHLERKRFVLYDEVQRFLKALPAPVRS